MAAPIIPFKPKEAPKPLLRMRVTVEVTPLNGADLNEVSDLVKELLIGSCGEEDSQDSFKDVELISAVEIS